MLPSTGWGQYAEEVRRRAKKARALGELLALDAQNAAKRRVDTDRTPAPFKEGDLVMMFAPTRKVGVSDKLISRHYGSYKVLRRISDLLFEVEAACDRPRRQGKGGRREIVHANRLKQFIPREGDLNPSDGEIGSRGDSFVGGRNVTSLITSRYSNDETRRKSNAQAAP